MIGPQSSAVQTETGPLLNGIVNYEYWLPTAAMNSSGVSDLISTYQERARGTSADALGYYVRAFAYAQLQVVEQAILATGGIDDAELAEYTRSATFSTVVGDVTFGRLGEWAVPRVLTVQFPRHRLHGHLGVRKGRTPGRAGAGELRERRTRRPVRASARRP